MQKLSPEDLISLEKYAADRAVFRANVMQHKKNRQVHLGANATLIFEDKLTIQYQIQEMLRIEKIFEAEGIQQELDAYNPLIPDGMNWKATFMLAYPDIEERKVMLSRLIGIEQKVWIQIEDFDKVYPISNEDLERETTEKTSAVHFLRFELMPAMIDKLINGGNVAMGIDHPEYNVTIDPIPNNIRNSLLQDLTTI